MVLQHNSAHGEYRACFTCCRSEVGTGNTKVSISTTIDLRMRKGWGAAPEIFTCICGKKWSVQWSLTCDKGMSGVVVLPVVGQVAVPDDIGHKYINPIGGRNGNNR